MAFNGVHTAQIDVGSLRGGVQAPQEVTSTFGLRLGQRAVSLDRGLVRPDEFFLDAGLEAAPNPGARTELANEGRNRLLHVSEYVTTHFRIGPCRRMTDVFVVH
jgi:hypothetical protein